MELAIVVLAFIAGANVGLAAACVLKAGAYDNGYQDGIADCRRSFWRGVSAGKAAADPLAGLVDEFVDEATR